MSTVIAIKLLPTAPRLGNDFTTDLTNLQVAVSDLTVKDGIKGIQLGTASGLVPDPFLPLPVVPATGTHPEKLALSIIQDVQLNVSTLSIDVYSVATAVVVVDIDPSTPDYEYPTATSYDLSIVLTRNSFVIGTTTIQYNATNVTLSPLPVDAAFYTGLPAAAYVYVPPVPPGGDGSISQPLLRPDGLAPNFEDLVGAVNNVITADHSTTLAGAPTSMEQRATPLTVQQCAQVAKELIYDVTLSPIPPAALGDLQSWYTIPVGSTSVDSTTDQNRKQFEGNLSGYYAVHDAQVTSLTSYIYAASCAIGLEKQSYIAQSVKFTFPLEGVVSTPSAGPSEISIQLQGVQSSGATQPLNPTFAVPAAYFYAMGSDLNTTLSQQDRWNSAVNNTEESIYQKLNIALNSQVLNASESTRTSTTNPQTLEIDRAARRMYALGAASASLPSIALDNSISGLVTGWLGYAGTTAAIDATYWADPVTIATGNTEYLELLLQIVTHGDANLEAAIKTAPLSVSSPAGLLAITDKRWTDFFIPPSSSSPPPTQALIDARAALLPDFTAPGNTTQRVNAFIRYLRQILDVPTDNGVTQPPHSGSIPILTENFSDAISQFLSANPTFTFASTTLNAATMWSTWSNPFTADLEMQAWVTAAVQTVWILYQVTLVTSTVDPKIQFSYMEALYSRGFINGDRIGRLTQGQFQRALSGTIAYPSTISKAIYGLAQPFATTLSDPGSEPASGFEPINPGDLIDCVPPPNLSPLGPVEYLFELLQLSVTSLAAAATAGSTSPSSLTLSQVLSGRRGPVGTLNATLANLEEPVPEIDLVNESLESLGSNLTVLQGAIYNTNGGTIAESLDSDECQALNLLPEHSTPAIPGDSYGVYDVLKKDFTAPSLPYAQDLDVNRTYLKALGTSRFEAMRVFRQEITEFVLDPPAEPTDFQHDLWRLPLRLDIAIEYLGITQDELNFLYTNVIDPSVLSAVYGFVSTETTWQTEILEVSVFLAKTGLTYCEFLDLQRCGYVPFGPSTDTKLAYPQCQPCCSELLHLVFPNTQTPIPSLQKLAVLIRLWRTLNARYCESISFALLANICTALSLFNGGVLNNDFLRQLIALFMLRDMFGIPLEERDPAQPPLPAGTPNAMILALWLDPTTSGWKQAADTLLDCIERHVIKKYRCPPRSAEYKKVLLKNLTAIAAMAGFTVDVPWNASPSRTLHFAEILTKIYASPFIVGEIIFLFTVSDHLLGDDPFPFTEHDESIEDPLNVPEDSHDGLWKLREKLLAAEASEEAAQDWSWRRIENFLRREFGTPLISSASVDPILEFGQQFFPQTLEKHGYHVTAASRQFKTSLSLANTSLLMWEAPPVAPFHYDATSSQLWAQLPLRDSDVLAKLSSIRQLKGAEQVAVRELYYAPRRTIAPFALLFTNFSHAVDYMIQEPDEAERFAYFQRNFTLFHARCRIIAEHLAHHVDIVTSVDEGGIERAKHCDADVAWRILRSLIADENVPIGNWEYDSGQPPDTKAFPWDPVLSGNAIAALLGLIGTGLEGEYTVTSSSLPQWFETRGPLDLFGSEARNSFNAPIPLIIPQLNLVTQANEQGLVTFRNGFALKDSTGQQLGGAEMFTVTWKGVLLIEKSGMYHFSAEQFRPHKFGGDDDDSGDCGHEECQEEPHHDHRDLNHSHLPHELHKRCKRKPSFSHDNARWIVKAQRGQKTYILLKHEQKSTEAAPAHKSLPAALTRGGYNIEVYYEQARPAFKDEDELHPAVAGIKIKYSGPDTDDECIIVPHSKLFIKSKDRPFGANQGKTLENSLAYLRSQYFSTLRDIRRTYQRAFKAILFAHRFELRAEPNEYCHGESELGFLLNHSSNFLGTSYYKQLQAKDLVGNDPSAKYLSHHAYFNFNFLPVKDAYMPPNPAVDDRVSPSAKRVSALFDWWERMFDYTGLRSEVHHCVNDKFPNRPLWFLFYEAAVQQPADAKSLVRHLHVDISLAPLALTYFNGYTVATTDLVDERWAIRVWHARLELQKIQDTLYSQTLEKGRPDLWASDQPSLVVDPSTTPPLSGNQNLTNYYQTSYLTDNKPQLTENIQEISDALRERGRCALLAFLCSMNRVSLASLSSDKPYATSSRDLSDLILQDVEAGLSETSSRIWDAIRAAQALVQRILLGVEPLYALPGGSKKSWSKTFQNFECWQHWQRRRLYSENWVHWEEIETARTSEAFQFLESQLPRLTTTIPQLVPALAWQKDPTIPAQTLLDIIQGRDFAVESIQDITASLDEGVGLIGTPAHAASPSWLAPTPQLPIPTASTSGTGSGTGTTTGGVGTISKLRADIAETAPSTDVDFPMWFKAAVKIGNSFMRVAAGGLPPAMALSACALKDGTESCACHCSKEHPPVMDEYYFWLTYALSFSDADAPQNADVGSVPPDITSDWDRPAQLPTLLNWPAENMVHLAWTRVHLGVFDPSRRSYEGIPYTNKDSPPDLVFSGRQVDSLIFSVTTSTVGGYRYDLATDTAVLMPQAIPDQVPSLQNPAGLAAFPFFIYFDPGAPLIPVSSFATSLAVAGALRMNCAFDAALKWCRSAYNPLSRDNTWAQCTKSGRATNGNQSLVTTSDSDNLPRDRPCCPSITVQPGIARSRAVLLEYLDILVQWSDALACQNTNESIQQAMVLLNEIYRILGPQPLCIDAQDGKVGSSMTISHYQASPPPLNPRLMHAYEKLANRRDAIHNCLNRRNLKNPRQKALQMHGCAQPEISACGTCPGLECNCMSCCQTYRYSSLYPKASEIISFLKTLGGMLLSAYEKSDAEYLAAIRAAHETQLIDLNIDIKQMQWRESDWQVQVLDQQIEGALTRLRYYQMLLSQGLNEGENGYVAGTEVAKGARTGASVSDGISQGMNMIPDFTIGGAGVGGSPVSITALPIGTKLAGAFSAASRVMNIVGDINSTNAGLMNTQGSWDRRSQEWQHQLDLVTIELEQLKRQRLAAERRRDISLQDLNNQQRQLEHSAEILDFMRDKFTKQELYLFLQQKTAVLYRQAFDLATQVLREAAQAFKFERADMSYELPKITWNNLHEGLMIGERMELALHSLDRTYMRTNCREYELMKHFSLRLHFPLNFMQLKAYGRCEIDIPEWMFDLDYPGHYLRRIKNVTLTIPCVVGPYVGVHGRLQLLSSAIRMMPDLAGPKSCCCHADGNTGKKDKKGKKGKKNKDCDDHYGHLCHRYAGAEAIATSTGQNDSGLFELNFHDERYMPFEYSGAISRWLFELPPENNEFDLETLSDVVMHFNYTSREGGTMLRRKAQEAAQVHLPGGGVRFFDIRHEFPEHWNSIFNPRLSLNHETKNSKNKPHRDLPLRLSRRMFPFITGRRAVFVTKLQVFVDATLDCGKHHFEIEFAPEHDDRDKDGRLKFACASTNDMPDFYHAAFDFKAGPIEGDMFRVVGSLRFPDELNSVRQVYLLYHYTVHEDARESGCHCGKGGKA